MVEQTENTWLAAHACSSEVKTSAGWPIVDGKQLIVKGGGGGRGLVVVVGRGDVDDASDPGGDVSSADGVEAAVPCPATVVEQPDPMIARTTSQARTLVMCPPPFGLGTTERSVTGS